MNRAERDFHKALVKKLEEAGALTFTVHGHVYQKRGWPDIQVYSPLWTGHLELKVDAAVEALQWNVIRRLRERGTDARVIRLTDGVLRSSDGISGCDLIYAPWPECSGRVILQELARTRSLRWSSN